MISLSHSWERIWAELNLSAPHGLHEQLLQAYSEPHRAYHTLQHLQECLNLFDEVRDLARHPAEIELALWFHDAVYQPRRSDNEALSAQWALRAVAQAQSQARGMGASPDTPVGMAAPLARVDEAGLSRIEGLILATRHDAQPTEPDSQLLVDIDLAILGAKPQRFDEYDAQVRQEYRWVPALLYHFRRKAVLRGFLDRQPLYATAALRDRLEDQAHANLKRRLS